MRACLQRVLRASVAVLDGAEGRREAGRIDGGLLALVGFAPSDGPEQLDWMAAKFADLRLFGADGGSGFDRSLRETGGGLLLVSQFTLYADARRGRRPDFAAAAEYAVAEARFRELRERCARELPGRVESGEFGARMEIELVNDGPVTLWLER